MEGDISTDLRRWKEGGWSSSALSTKTNGRWTYFFEPKSVRPMNLKEPISYDAKYIPPNKVKESLVVPPKIRKHAMREQFLSTHLQGKAPLAILNKAESKSTLVPSVWNSTLPAIQEQAQKAQQSTQRLSYIRRRASSSMRRMNHPQNSDGGSQWLKILPSPAVSRPSLEEN